MVYWTDRAEIVGEFGLRCTECCTAAAREALSVTARVPKADIRGGLGEEPSADPLRWSGGGAASLVSRASQPAEGNRGVPAVHQAHSKLPGGKEPAPEGGAARLELFWFSCQLTGGLARKLRGLAVVGGADRERKFVHGPSRVIHRFIFSLEHGAA